MSSSSATWATDCGADVVASRLTIVSVGELSAPIASRRVPTRVSSKMSSATGRMPGVTAPLGPALPSGAAHSAGHVTVPSTSCAVPVANEMPFSISPVARSTSATRWHDG